MRLLLFIVLVTLFAVGVVGFYHVRKPLPSGIEFRGPDRVLNSKDIQFFADVTASTKDDQPWVQQEIFEEVFRRIQQADGFVVADFFLVNEFAGGVPDGVEGPSLSQQLIDALISARKKHPEMPIILITDPLNTLYGGLEQPLFAQLESNGIEVVLTDLRKLRDSNQIFSPVWRTFFQWWGDPQGEMLKNPIGDGRIGLSAFLELLNFKANHRKTLITGNLSGELFGLVTSGNPHSASAMHSNVALGFTGPLAADLLQSEAAVYEFSTGQEFPRLIQEYLDRDYESVSGNDATLSAVVLTEMAIKRELIDRFDRLERGDRADLAIFYFSDMELQDALEKAIERGARIRLLMDPNKDAFGREKNGIPNRQVAASLIKKGVEVRWYRTSGEQFHTKMAFFDYGEAVDSLIVGSANWTRRNLDNLNLETSVSVTGPARDPLFVDVKNYFTFIWTNGAGDWPAETPNGVVSSVPYDEFKDESGFRKILYWIMERTGASTF